MSDAVDDTKIFKAENRMLKHQCHMLIDEIWGQNHEGRGKGYGWLAKQFGHRMPREDVHFAQINDLDLLRSMQRALRNKLDNQYAYTVGRMTDAKLGCVWRRQHKKKKHIHY